MFFRVCSGLSGTEGEILGDIRAIFTRYPPKSRSSTSVLPSSRVWSFAALDVKKRLLAGSAGKLAGNWELEEKGTPAKLEILKIL